MRDPLSMMDETEFPSQACPTFLASVVHSDTAGYRGDGRLGRLDEWCYNNLAFAE